MTPTDLSRAVWRRSSYNGGGGECVEIAALDDGQITVRDSKQPNGAVLLFTRPELAAWIKTIKHHQFDALT